MTGTPQRSAIGGHNARFSVRRPDLPGMPLPVQIFVVGVQIALWKAQQSAAAASSRPPGGLSSTTLTPAPRL